MFFQARESSEAREGRLARWEGRGRGSFPLRPLVTEPSPRRSRGAGRWARAAGPLGRGGSLGRSSPLGPLVAPVLSSLSAFVLRVLVGSELAECAFPHTVRLVSAAERWLKKRRGYHHSSHSLSQRVSGSSFN